jgi:hypothetical protein
MEKVCNSTSNDATRIILDKSLSGTSKKPLLRMHRLAEWKFILNKIERRHFKWLTNRYLIVGTGGGACIALWIYWRAQIVMVTKDNPEHSDSFLRKAILLWMMKRLWKIFWDTSVAGRYQKWYVCVRLIKSPHDAIEIYWNMVLCLTFGRGVWLPHKAANSSNRIYIIKM